LKFSLYIAKRYLFSKGSTNAINIITAIAMLGIIIGALILTIVLSAFSGLRELHLQSTSITDPHLKLFPVKGKFFRLSEQQKVEMSSLESIIDFAEIVENQVFLNYKDKKQYANIKGINKNYSKVIATDSIIAYGNWDFNNKHTVVIGDQISNSLSLGINNTMNPLNLYMPKAGKGQIVNPIDAFRSKSVRVSGIYRLTNEIDDKYVFTHIDLARDLLNIEKNKVSNIELKLTPKANEDKVRRQLLNVFNNTIYIKSREQLNEATYKMLKSENLMAYSVSTLVLIVALFNLIGSMIMMIIDKKKNLQTLYKMGATVYRIRRIFFLQGVLMTVIGGVIGVGLGFVILFLQKKYGLVMITYEIAYPVQLSFTTVVIVFMTLFSLGFVASIIASRSIKKSLIT